MTENRGPDGLTARERMEARGFEIDERGNTVEDGWDGMIRSRRNPAGKPHPAAHGLFASDPDVELRCGVKGRDKACGRLLAQVWKPREPGDDYAMKWDHGGGPLLDWARVPGNDAVPAGTPLDSTVAVICPQHGPARVHIDFVRMAADATPRSYQLIDVRKGFIG